MMSSRRRGFTLIELLVVIAIIAILAAILFPVFANARNKAKETKCLSHFKEIALALQMYVSDYEGAWPSVRIYGVNGFTDFQNNVGKCQNKLYQYGGIPSLLGRYIKSYRMWWCPSDSANKPSRDPNSSTSYEYRWVLAYDTSRHNIMDGSFAHPSKTVVYHEKEDWHGGRYGLYQLRGQSKGQPKVNSIYADCHARMWAIKESPKEHAWIYDYHWLWGCGTYEMGKISDVRKGWD